MTGKDIQPHEPTGEFLLYQTEDGRTRIECRFEAETLWLSQAQIAELFQTTPQNITLHLKSIYQEGELSAEATCKDYLQVRKEGARTVRRTTRFYNLEAVLAVGFRVRSHRGVQFRQWAGQTLQEYIRKGFALDDARLKEAGGGAYFEELLARIRDIRSSERVFWRKVMDIYATSMDYDPRAEASSLFFKTVQNKMHWAAHGHTAAEVIHARVDASQLNLGLTSWKGAQPRKADVAIAKNYLASDELEALNRIVTAYLEFAEVQALNRKPMTMANWITKLDDFLRLSDRELLTHAGSISHEQATQRANIEYQQWQQQQASLPQPVDEHFNQAIEQLKTVEKQLQQKKPKE